MNSKQFDRAAVLVPQMTAFAALRLRLLVDMRESGASPEYCLTHSGIGSDLPREMLSPLLKSMRKEGLVFHQIGLWTEGGDMAGAGHGLTVEGAALADRLIAESTP